ncbi:23S rRNA (uracil(1939)-C(5))-methyltransferase RlmD [Silvibacterium acidisoli]|uniref:23S rRNA (uracil(1939)-C(5))-methyltransferase RlmD n=1 Tax=Acidobacteriaceae bacterium ZG23-2 TaxID=2883246 RepID=UPI00406C230A
MKLEIEKAIYGGAGLARSDGKAIFVPFTLPGEIVEAQIAEDRGSFANAELAAILDPSPARTEPPCPYFGSCGGCHYQHAQYEQQLQMKRSILQESLERVRIASYPEIAALHGDAFGYRNRIRLHVDRQTSALCYKKRASHQNLPVTECPIAAPVLERALRRLIRPAVALELGNVFEEMELFTNDTQDTTLISFWSSQGKKAATAALQQLWPHIEGFVRGAAVFATKSDNPQESLLAAMGDKALVYSAAGEQYRVSIGSFFQVNRFLVDRLAGLVTAEKTGRIAWDLYAGVGLFARALSHNFEQVVAVESAPSSTLDLRENLSGKSAKVVAAGTLDFLRRAKSHPRPDFVVVDPPRAGLGKEVCSLLGEIRAPQITYVSCDPATLSRDLKALLDSGYHFDSISMVDLFPQTFHLESVVSLSLR